MIINVTFREITHSFRPKFGEVIRVGETAPDVEQYTGDYEVTPTVDGQTLPTAQKLMTDDVTIKAIPTYSVSNTAGGETFYIATMDE